jgi:hypothetical protein
LYTLGDAESLIGEHMGRSDYVKNCLKTEVIHARLLVLDRLSSKDGAGLRLVHASLGLASEHGELISGAKNMDRVNLLEEMGDILWYLAIAIDALKLPTDLRVWGGPYFDKPQFVRRMNRLEFFSYPLFFFSLLSFFCFRVFCF